ncbi:MAG: carboxypeptidase-like regulatory domain-containing protein [Bacteroidetes bacterium]|nr:carboxypeptidase-like regulatory domain-containing protein [Bacteroidota bacterium]
MKARICIFLWGLLGWGVPVAAQQPDTLVGRVIDATSGEGLPFALVKTLQGQAGAVTDVNGYFMLRLQVPGDSVEASYMGFISRRFALPDSAGSWVLPLSPKLVETDAITVEAGENPALAIVRQMIANRPRHNPRKLEAYHYASYTKLTLGGNPRMSKQMDSLMRVMRLMMWESTSRRYYVRPDKDYELITGSRISGLQGMAIPFSPTEVQDIGFYDDWVRILEQDFLSPIAFSGPKRYRYYLRDTLFQGTDTLYIIHFSPEGGFGQGLVGEMRVHSADYALQSISAEAILPDDVGLWIRFKIKQVHEKRPEGIWFPRQLYTEVHLHPSKLQAKPQEFFVLEARTYLDSIGFEPQPIPHNAIVLDVSEQAGKQPDTFWSEARQDSLLGRERQTYTVLDSLGRKYKWAGLVRQFNKIQFGYLAVGIFDLDLARLYRLNRVESNRLGMGLHTNERLSSAFSVGGWGGWGTGDARWKYGLDVHLHPFHNKNLRLHYEYDEDLVVTGAQYVGLKNKRMLYDRPAQYQSSRMLFMEIMDYSTQHQVSLFFSSLGNLNHRFSLLQDRVRPAYTYFYKDRNVFSFTEAIAELRWAPSEKFRREGRTLYSLGSKWPVCIARLTLGVEGLLGGEYAYQKAEISVSQQRRLSGWLSLNYQVNAGVLQGALPYSRLYIFHANGEPNFIAEGYAFNTMFFNDFTASRYAVGYLHFQLVNQRFPGKKYNPDIRLVCNGGWGSLQGQQAPDAHAGDIPLRAPELGYWETGVALINLMPRPAVKLVSTLQFLGFGLYLRMGAYAQPEFVRNLAPKMEYRIKF